MLDMDVLGCFKKSILANGEDDFKVNRGHSFGEPHTAERIQVSTEGATETVLVYGRTGNGPEFHGELDPEEPFPCV